MTSPAPREVADLYIPIPNTHNRLPLTWEHTRAIQQLSRFFARLYARVSATEDKDGLNKYQSWMITLFQMDASIHEELVIRNDPDEICAYLTSDDREDEDLETLEAANNLIIPLMDFIRECKERAAA